MSSLDPPPSLRRTSSSVFDPPHPSLRIQPVIVEPKPFREFKAHDTLSPTVLLNPSFDNFNLGGGESSTKGKREFVDLASEEVEREELDDWTNKEIEDVSVCCLSGGTGGNAICSTFSSMTTTFILPISDDGGSSSEILRCLGGPSIGDIRSRLIRLAPSPTSPSCPPALAAVTRLLSHRFPWDVDEKEAKDLWREVVEGTSELWDGIDGDKREVLHRFFVFFESELLQRAHKGFSFRNCSLGNVFLSSAQRFFLSLPAAIFLFSSITQTQGRSTVIPAILTNHTATIAAELANSQTILGQCNISHPVLPAAPPSQLELIEPPRPVTPSPPIRRRQHTPSFGYLRVEDGLESPSSSGQATPTNGGGASGSSQSGGNGGGGAAKGNLVFTRTRAAGGDEEDGEEHEEEGGGLESRIERIFYINYVGTEIYPLASPEYLNALESKEVLVYSCGSLWTSIIPCLALQGVGSAIAESTTLRAKVLLLNSENDRETKSYTALDYIDAIVRTLNRYDTPPPILPQQTQPRTFTSSSPLSPNPSSPPPPPPPPKFLPTDVITHLVYLVDGRVEVDVLAIEALGIKVVAVERLEAGGEEGEGKNKKKKGAKFDAENVRRGLGRVIKGLRRS